MSSVTKGSYCFLLYSQNSFTYHWLILHITYMQDLSEIKVRDIWPCGGSDCFIDQHASNTLPVSSFFHLNYRHSQRRFSKTVDHMYRAENVGLYYSSHYCPVASTSNISTSVKLCDESHNLTLVDFFDSCTSI